MFDASRRHLLAAGGSALLAGRASAIATPGKWPCAAAAVPSARVDGVHTGGARTVRVDGKYAVWVKQVGSGGIPVLTLHGGPGFNHFYLECLEDFLPQQGICFWFYDQLGCGFSDAPDDASLWTIERYREEVEQVRRALGLDRFILFGHSWGGMLGMEYALKYPQHLAGLVISNMTASVAAYVEYAESLVKKMPQAAQEIIAKYRAAGDFAAPEYQHVLMSELYQRHVCRLKPWPEPLLRTFRTINAKIYNTMQGPDEFDIVGNFNNWNIWARLPQISVPTLLIAARYDEMSPAQIRRMGTLIPGARVAFCEHGSHMALYDDQRAYFDFLVPFLHGAYRAKSR